MLKKRFLVPLALLLGLSSTAFADVTVTFQVDMTVQIALGNFDPVNDIVVVRGDFNGWSGTDPTCIDNGEGVYQGDWVFGDGDIGLTQEFKYVMVTTEGDVWESISNRNFVVPETDTMLDVVFFDDNDSAGDPCDVEVLFQVDMTVLIALGTFDPETDLITIRGAHANLGGWGPGPVMNQVTGMEGHYDLLVQFDQVESGTPSEFKYVWLPDGNQDDPQWEQNDNRSFTPELDLPDENENGYGEIELEEVFFSNMGWDDIISQDVDVVFQVNIQPALWNLLDGQTIEACGETVVDPEDILYVACAGFFNEWPWCDFGEEYQATTENGILYTCTVPFYTGDPRELIYKYGINGGDNEAGFAENHEIEIDDAESTFVIDPPDMFGSQSDWYAVGDIQGVPAAFQLHANYPNPFNPTTTISYNLAVPGPVQLAVYNLMGERVACLVDEAQTPSEYRVEFNAAGLASGVYFYRLTAGDYSVTKKMMLLK